MSKLTLFLKKKDLYLGFTRYALGLIMIIYGVSKILKTQFVVIPFAEWQRPLEHISGRMLAWAFLGYSPWFQIMLGFLELIPAILLLFRRTTLVGAILLFPMTLNVFIINRALNLWDDTKVVSLVLLLLNIAVLIFEWKPIKEILLIVVGKGKQFKYHVAELAVNAIVVIAVIILFSQWLLSYMHETNALTGDWYHHHPYEWTLQSEKINDSVPGQRLLKIYFGAFGEYSEINDKGYFYDRSSYNYKLDEKKHQLKFYDGKNKLISNWRYQLVNDSLLQLEKVIDTGKAPKLVRVFKKRVMQTGAD